MRPLSVDSTACFGGEVQSNLTANPRGRSGHWNRRFDARWPDVVGGEIFPESRLRRAGDLPSFVRPDISVAKFLLGDRLSVCGDVGASRCTGESGTTPRSKC